jgi:dihydrofolate synthase/folylpolyglutamate synthase
MEKVRLTKINSEKDAIAYLTHRDWRASRRGLERMRELLDGLGNPQDRLRFVHVAGTNGKGSVCAMLANILQAAGLATGLYTSPYINRFNERIQVDGEPIAAADLVSLTRTVQKIAAGMADCPTVFEMITAIGFEYFYRRGCDAVVLEVGMGGRLDATNVIRQPELAVITPVSFDHTAELGETLGKIAAEKGGIIKGGKALSALQPDEAASALQKICDERGAALIFTDVDRIKVSQNTLAGQVFSFDKYADICISLLGAHQRRNAALVLTAVRELRLAGWPLDDAAIYRGLAATRWPARFEVLRASPAVIVDGGHNPQCAACLAECLAAYFPGEKVTFVTGVMADKDYPAMMAAILPAAARFFTVTPDSPRALPAADLAAYLQAQGAAAVPCTGAAEALRQAQQSGGVVCAFGSFYLAGEIRGLLGPQDVLNFPAIFL